MKRFVSDCGLDSVFVLNWILSGHAFGMVDFMPNVFLLVYVLDVTVFVKRVYASACSRNDDISAKGWILMLPFGILVVLHTFMPLMHVAG